MPLRKQAILFLAKARICPYDLHNPSIQAPESGGGTESRMLTHGKRDSSNQTSLTQKSRDLPVASATLDCYIFWCFAFGASRADARRSLQEHADDFDMPVLRTQV